MSAHGMLIIILVLSPLNVFIVHAAASRIMRKTPAQTVAIRAIILGAVPTGLMLWKLFLSVNGAIPGGGVLMVYCVVVYCSLGYTYFHFFNMSETARRIRILYEIHRAGTMPLAELTVLYKSNDIIALRLERLLALGHVIKQGGYYMMDSRYMYWAARIIDLWRRVLALDRHER